MIRTALEAMLGVLDEKDWIQGDLFEALSGARGDQTDIDLEDVTGVCLAGSYTYALLTGALRSEEGFFGVSEALLAVARDLFPGRKTATIPKFNDDKNTTREDIILVLKTAVSKS